MKSSPAAFDSCWVQEFGVKESTRGCEGKHTVHSPSSPPADFAASLEVGSLRKGTGTGLGWENWLEATVRVRRRRRRRRRRRPKMEKRFLTYSRRTTRPNGGVDPNVYGFRCPYFCLFLPDPAPIDPMGHPPFPTCQKKSLTPATSSATLSITLTCGRVHHVSGRPPAPFLAHSFISARPLGMFVDCDANPFTDAGVTVYFSAQR